MTQETVYLVDDDASFLSAMTRFLKAAGFDVRAFGSAAQLLAGVTATARGCVVADLSMPGMDGLELQAELARNGVPLPVVFLSGHGDIPSSVRAMREGAVDFLEKHAPQEQLLQAVRSALEREAHEHASRARIAELKRRFESLTHREREVLAFVVKGRMNKEIAAALDINERTVKLHRTAITTKIGVHSAAQLATLAADADLFSSDETPIRGR